ANTRLTPRRATEAWSAGTGAERATRVSLCMLSAFIPNRAAFRIRCCHRGLVPDVLQEPFGGNLAAKPRAPHRLVDFAGDRVELRALQVAAFGIGDLVGRGAAPDLAL